MITTQDIFGAFFIAIIISYGFTPLARQIAFKIKLLDHPSSKKSHAHPTPLLGGLSILLAFFTAVFFTTNINSQMYGILAGGIILMTLGMIDDKLGMMPKMKLSGQILAALIVYKAGVRVITFEDYYVSMFFTVFWIVGITNAFNLLDNLNGLSSGIAGISAIFFGVMALLNSQVYVAVLAFALAGACFGFLKHNFPEAKIFMGDSGSMFLGFTLACIAILGSWETEKISLSFCLPILVLGYPIFDTTLVTFLRIKEKRSIFIGGKDHSSHILASLGFKKKRAVVLIYVICMMLGLAAFLISVFSLAIGTTIFVITTLSMFGFGIYLWIIRSKSAKLRRKHK
ncbi:MAG: undecaprenyl/decaprenyl-phosphate alpha-N-acetylglucosaminyl 1-phosphate transferase [Candidatus Omnitrophica bacterium]|nr:undecaprenyl/decaprenyl-phosphate alpha-N-acetylglucosaminyl 1-phosphate transferase [Candidatus Omnitrophota bacterium]